MSCDNCPGEEAEHHHCARCIAEWRADEEARAAELGALRAELRTTLLALARTLTVRAARRELKPAPLLKRAHALRQRAAALRPAP